MREIKFRVWDKVRKKMFLQGNNAYEDMQIINYILGPKDTEDYHGFNYKDYELMQYTGLKDKNGKEIYEEDILNGNWLGVERKGIVKYISEIASFGILFSGRETPCAVINKNDWFLENSNFRCEVIGNIYENPELLEAMK